MYAASPPRRNRPVERTNRHVQPLGPPRPPQPPGTAAARRRPVADRPVAALPARPFGVRGDAANRAKSFGKAKNCILLYLSGAPSQLDTFDPKPDAPDDIRGEFSTIPTTVPGVRFSELLPLSAQLMDRIALVRTLTHDHNDHGRGSYWMFTGYPYTGSVSDVNSMSRADMPHMGSCVAKLNPGAGPMFPFVLVPHRMDVAGGRRAGQFAGALGAKYDPLLTGGNPNDDDYHMEQLPLAPTSRPTCSVAAWACSTS